MARDGSAPFLNPATIVGISDLSFAFSANLYSFSLAHYTNWHQPGAVPAAQFGALQLSDTSLNEGRFDVIPSTLCLFFSVGPAGRGRQKLAACLGTTERQLESFPALNYRSRTGSGTVATQTHSVSHGWLRFRAGPTWSVQATDQLAFGATLHGVYTSYDRLWSVNAVAIDANGKPLESSFDSSASGTSIDLVATLGATYQMDRHTTFGVSAELPSFHVTSTYDASLANNYGGGGADHTDLVIAHGNFEAPPPAHLALGIGGAWDKLKVEANATFYAPLSSALSSTLHADAVAIDHGGATASATLGTFSERANAVLDSAFGVEYFVSPTLSVLSGFATDFTPVPQLSAERAPSVGQFYQERLERVAFSAGVGSYGGLGDLLLGAQLGYGWGKAYVVDSYVLPNELVLVDKSAFNVIFVVAGNASLATLERTFQKMRELIRP
jgi:hypothetical protein